MRILIVEDEVKIRMGISKLISQHTGHKVVGEAKNGIEGLEMILKFHPDLIISDIRMPSMDGLEMLEELEKMGVHYHCVILSGYSEFDYAKKAIRYGVDDYLLKPIAAEDVNAILEKVQEKLDLESRQMLGTPEGYIRDIILGNLEANQENCDKLMRIGHLEDAGISYLLLAYMGNVDMRYRQHCENAFEKMKGKYPYYRIFIVYIESTQELVVLVQCDLPMGEIISKVERMIFLGISKDEQPVWTIGEIDTISNMRSQAKKLQENYVYGMAFGYHHLITQKEVEDFRPQEYKYPKFLENKIRIAICDGGYEKLNLYAAWFQEYLRDAGYDPAHIRNGYMKMLSFISNMAQEVSTPIYQQIKDINIMKALGEAVTLQEIEQGFRMIIDKFMVSENKKEDIRNYTIKKALVYIREHYQEGISLEIVADNLEITPEYLSTLFNKEVGLNFTTFVKRFRISHAKRLLKGSELKIYQIASEVGYNDPKYFNRVFKEEVGISPGDYRQLQ